MARDWVLDVKAGEKGKDVSLGLRADREGGLVVVAASCESLDAFAQEIARIKRELDGLLEEARARMDAVGVGAVKEAMSPEAAWKKMESFASEEEMFGFFNSLADGDRHRIAEYIFSHVNMFKGRGPVFSEHYDTESHVLE